MQAPVWRDHALWLMVPSFIHGIHSLEVVKWFVVMLWQESCGLCKWHMIKWHIDVMLVFLGWV